MRRAWLVGSTQVSQKMTDAEAKTKRGPKPERLRIEEDPQAALRKLLSTPPPEAEAGELDEEQEEQAESPQRD